MFLFCVDGGTLFGAIFIGPTFGVFCCGCWCAVEVWSGTYLMPTAVKSHGGGGFFVGPGLREEFLIEEF